MNPTVVGALIGAGSAVIVALAGIWANVKNTRATTEVSCRAVEAQQRTVELTEQGQVADRFTKAIDQLGSDMADVRIGGIYALERVANDSEEHHRAVMDVLTVFVRRHSHDPRPAPDPSGGKDERSTLPDVQVAIRAIGRLQDDRELNLTAADLTDAILDGANLSNAWLHRAVFNHASAHDAKFIKARLRKADFTRANLENADFTEAEELTEADFTGAKLKGARWPERVPAPKGWARDSGSGRLKHASQDASAPGT